MEKLRETLREFYSLLKSCDDLISFVFVTGITKYVQGGLYSAFNNPTDISLEPGYGAIAGFTHEELSLNYPKQIRETAVSLNMATDELLKKMEEFYNGFSFDAKTLVYNPYSMLLFFRKKNFYKFWFNTGTPAQLPHFFKGQEIISENFRGVEVEKDDIFCPDSTMELDPKVFLFQVGFLSLRPSSSPDSFLLVYPNKEVEQAMERHIFISRFKSKQEADDLSVRLRKALISRDPALFIEQFNMYLANQPFDFYGKYGKKIHDESFYRMLLVSLIIAVSSASHTETHKSVGKSDLVTHFGDITWVIELKVYKPDMSKIMKKTEAAKDKSKEAEAMKDKSKEMEREEMEEKEEKEELQKAIDQIKARRYSKPFYKPVMIALVINDRTRDIKEWWCSGGLSTGPAPIDENK
jgi:hypothetical protein